MIDQWHFVYRHYDSEQEGRREALCTLGNGYFATRAASTDSVADSIHYPGTYLAGGYNRLTSKVDSHEFENEDLVNLPNWLSLTFRVEDGPWFRIDDVEILSYRQALDLKSGQLHRDIRFRDAAGRTTLWRERRIVSMAQPHMAGLEIELTAEDWAGEITLRSALDGSVVNGNVRDYHDLASRHLEMVELGHLGRDVIFLRARTNQSMIHIAQAARTLVYRADQEVEVQRRTNVLPDMVYQDITCSMRRGQGIVVEKLVAMHSSLDHAISEPGLAAKQALAEAGRFEALFSAHQRIWHQLWEECDISLEEHATPGTDLKLRLHIFHILQTVSVHTADRDVGVPARGWHGEGYRGHIFWDELYVFPFLNLRIPILTRALLLYRYRRLDAARRAARDAGFQGAMYPWQSASDGTEQTPAAYLNPLSGRWIEDYSFRQRHISSAIAYNIWQYHQATDDDEFLYAYGAEMLLEIARFWASTVTYNKEIDRYEISGVMGPDEFHTAYMGADIEKDGGLRNSAYTNIMAAWVLDRASDVLALVPAIRCKRLCERIGLSHNEIKRWHDISMRLRVPFHADGIISQFENYKALREFDWAQYEKKYGNIGRLDFILEAENDTPNAYKLAKQADVLMLFYLFSADELRILFEQLGYPFEHDTIPKNVEYYIGRTSHGSTLSRVAHSWVLARSDRRQSWHLFQKALDSDIADIQGGTTREGIHIGAMAGVIDLVQRCYLGIEMRANVLHFDPALPSGLGRVKVRLRYRRQILDVEADRERLKISSRQFTAAPITVAYRGYFRDVAPGDSYEFLLLKPEERLRDENHPAATDGLGGKDGMKLPHDQQTS